MSHRLAAFACSLVLLSTLAAAVDRDGGKLSPRLPVPAEAERAKAQKLVRELFAAELAKRSPADRLAAARKLITQAADTTDDPAARYVLLEEARDLAVAAGDVEVAMSAAEELVATFRVKRAAPRLAAVPAANKAGDVGAVVRALITISDDAVADEDWSAAGKAASLAATAAGRVRDDKALVARARVQPANVARAQQFAAAAAEAKRRLEESPDDPKANLLLGRYLCFTRDDWPTGMPHLAQGADPLLKRLARQESSAPADAAGMAALADAWWTAADSSKEDAEPMRMRAGHWYRKALPDLSGLAKSVAQKRLAGLTGKVAQHARVYRVSEKEKGISLGMEERDVGENFRMEFDVRTVMSTAGHWGVVLTKRHHPDDGCLTVIVRGDGTLAVVSDAAWHRVDTEGRAKVNDGKWHRVVVEKRGIQLTLTVNGNVDAESSVEPKYQSRSPWMIGWHGGWGGGAFDGEVRILQVGDPED